MKKLVGNGALIVLIAVVLSACGSLETARVNQKRDLRLIEYGQTVRWGHLSDVYAFLAPAEQAVQTIPEHLDNIRVTQYEVLMPPVPEGEHKFTQTVKIEYLFEDQQVVRTLIDTQVWEFDTDARQWFRTNPPPLFK